MQRLVLALTTLLLSAIPAYAWGDKGHAIIAELAERRLVQGAREKVAELLGEGVSLASISSWADDFTFQPGGDKTGAWHYINLQKGENPAVQGSACVLKPIGDCLPKALERQFAILNEPKTNKPGRVAALKFIVHLIGDLTQPLHCIERNGDNGGNELIVDLVGNGPDGRPLLGADKVAIHQVVTFHQLWDSTLIDNHSFSFGAYVEELDISVAPLVLWPDGRKPTDFDDWAMDCHNAGVRLYDGLPSGKSPLALDAAYQQKVQASLDAQLALGGVLLARVLNEALALADGKPKV